MMKAIERASNVNRIPPRYPLAYSDDRIHWLTALVLQLLHVSADSSNVGKTSKTGRLGSGNQFDKKVVEIWNKVACISWTLSESFLPKKSPKLPKRDANIHPIIECFMNDLLATLNRPEWPASRLCLTEMAEILMEDRYDKNSSMRVGSLKWLGIIVARMRQDEMEMARRQKQMDDVIKRIEGKSVQYIDENGVSE